VKEIGFAEDANPRFRRTMEDAHIVCDAFGEDKTQGYFAIYDGHGGRNAVEYTVDHLHLNFQEELKTNTDPKEALKQSFLKTDREIGERKIDSSGSTAVVAFIRRTEGKLYVANCGDARAVLGASGKASRLSHDHKGTDEGEVKRITDLGGFVVLNRVNGVLAVTRAFGDFNMKEFVTADPFITTTDLPDDSQEAILILACDGLWDVVSDQEAVDFVVSRIGKHSIQQVSEMLLHHALDSGSTDNVSIMVIKL